MRKRFRRLHPRRPSPALVISVIALFVSLGGTGYATLTVTGKDVKDSSLTTADVKDTSLLSKDFKLGQLPAGPPGSDASSILTGRIERLQDYGNGPPGANYAYPQGDTPATGFTSEVDATELSPARAIVARDLVVKEDHVSPNAIATRNYILRVNGQDSALRCQTTAGSTNPTGTTECSDTTHAVTIPAGSTICLNAEQNYYTGGGFGTSIPVRFGWLAASH